MLYKNCYKKLPRIDWRIGRRVFLQATVLIGDVWLANVFTDNFSRESVRKYECFTKMKESVFVDKCLASFSWASVFIDERFANELLTNVLMRNLFNGRTFCRPNVLRRTFSDFLVWRSCIKLYYIMLYLHIVCF